MKVVSYGTCQLYDLYNKYLSQDDFFKNATYNHYPSYTCARQKQTLNLDEFKTADIFIYQPLSSKYGLYSTDEILKYIPANAKIISIPFFYLDIYPIYESFSKLFGTGVLDKVKDLEEKEIIYKYTNLELDFNLRERFCNSIYRLVEKEKVCLIHYSEFIVLHFQHIRLLFSSQHPAPPIYKYIANQIFKEFQLQTNFNVFEPYDEGIYVKEPDSVYMVKELSLQYPKDCEETVYAKTILCWYKNYTNYKPMYTI
jgi:hypothetical protein